MTKLAIIDLDRTVADCTVRFDKARKPDGKIDWKIALDPRLAYFEDTVIPGSVEAIQTLVNDGYTIIYLTGRPENMREMTQLWLAHAEIHGFQFDTLADFGPTVALPSFHLVMRPDRDFRKAPIFKQQEVDKLVEQYKPDELLFIDDLVEDDAKILEHIPYAHCYPSLKAAIEDKHHE